MSKTLIKQLAQNAKSRMKNSSYKQISKTKTNIIVFENTKISENQIEIKNLDTTREEDLKNKIIKILEDDFYCLNPIAKLIDQNYYQTLSTEQKQKYLLTIANLYTDIKKEFTASLII